MEFATCVNRDADLCLREYWMVVDLFCFCDFDLDPMTFIYELACIVFRYSRLRHTYILTDKQTLTDRQNRPKL